jgi:hypothetical protein
MWVEEIVLNGESYMFGKADRDTTIILVNVRDLQRQSEFVRSTTAIMIDSVDGRDTIQAII